MTLLDAYALLALLLDEPAADEVQSLLREREAAVTVINLAEAIDIAQRVRRLPPERVVDALAPLVGDLVRVRAHGESEAWRAAAIRSSYYDARRRSLSLADCLLLAAAEAGDEIATADPAVAEVVRAEGLGLIALPDSSGRRP